jgi:hypothetical protein
MYATSVFYKQIYPSLFHHRQFPNPEGVWPGRSGRPCPTRPEIEGAASLLETTDCSFLDPIVLNDAKQIDPQILHSCDGHRVSISLA